MKFKSVDLLMRGKNGVMLRIATFTDATLSLRTGGEGTVQGTSAEGNSFHADVKLQLGSAVLIQGDKLTLKCERAKPLRGEYLKDVTFEMTQ